LGEKVDIWRYDSPPADLWYVGKSSTCERNVLFGSLMLVVNWYIDILGMIVRKMKKED